MERNSSSYNIAINLQIPESSKSFVPGSLIFFLLMNENDRSQVCVPVCTAGIIDAWEQ